MDTTQEHEPAREDRDTLGGLLRQLAQDTVGLLRDEIDLVRQGIRDDGRLIVNGLVIVAIGLLVGQLALLAFSVTDATAPACSR